MAGVQARREQVAYARRRGLWQRRSCTLLGGGALLARAEAEAKAIIEA